MPIYLSFIFMFCLYQRFLQRCWSTYDFNLCAELNWFSTWRGSGQEIEATRVRTLMNGFPLVSRVMCVTFFHKKSQVSSFASPPEAKQPTSSSRNFVVQNRFFPSFLRNLIDELSGISMLRENISLDLYVLSTPEVGVWTLLSFSWKNIYKQTCLLPQLYFKHTDTLTRNLRACVFSQCSVYSERPHSGEVDLAV